jgi:hypothetical protein
MKTSDLLLEITPDFEYRTIGDKIFSGKIRVPGEQIRSAAAWRDRQTHCDNPADIQVIDANILRECPVSPQLLDAAYSWMQMKGLPDLSEKAEDSASLCKGALYHHDISAFQDSVFCVVWLEKSQGLELVFPQLNVRIPLQLGTIVAFDAAQPHAVLRAGDAMFEPEHYADVSPQAFVGIDFNALIPGVSEVMEYVVRPTAEGWPGPVVLITQNGPDVDRITGAWTTRGDYQRPSGTPANAAR